MKDYRFADLAVGLRESFSVTVTQEMMDAFLRLSGDDNPIHVDAEYARRQGFEGRVVYGLLGAAFYSTLVGVHLPGRYAVLHGIDVSFHHPVYVGDVLTVTGEVAYLNAAFRQAELKAEITDQRGRRVSKAKIKAGFYGAEAASPAAP